MPVSVAASLPVERDEEVAYSMTMMTMTTTTVAAAASDAEVATA